MVSRPPVRGWNGRRTAAEPCSKLNRRSHVSTYRAYSWLTIYSSCMGHQKPRSQHRNSHRLTLPLRRTPITGPYAFRASPYASRGRLKMSSGWQGRSRTDTTDGESSIPVSQRWEVVGLVGSELEKWMSPEPCNRSAVRLAVPEGALRTTRTPRAGEGRPKGRNAP